MNDWKSVFPNENKYGELKDGILYNGDVIKILKNMPDESVDCMVTSPPYFGLRQYDVDNKAIGEEDTYQEYINKMADILDEVKRVLKPHGTCWVNIGDSYNSKSNKKGKVITSDSSTIIKKSDDKLNKIKQCDSKKQEGIPPKSIMFIPERLGIELINRGWIIRNNIIWHKPNSMPESVTDRFTAKTERILFMVKNEKYYFNMLREGNRQMRDVWSIPIGESSKGNKAREEHPATFPTELPKRCIKAGCPEDGIVLDIFGGSGTTATAARMLNKKWIYIDISTKYCELTHKYLKRTSGFLGM